MRPSRLIAVFGLFIAIVVITFILNKPSSDSPSARHNHSHEPYTSHTEPTNRGSRAGASRVTASSTPSNTPHPASTQPKREASQNEALLNVLEKYSGSRNWRFDTDDSGRVFKMTGTKLKGVMRDGPTQASFLSDLQDALEFREPARFAAESQATSSVSVVDKKQLFEAPDGTTLPVFEAKVRLIGDASGDAFMVYNELRPLESSLRWASTLETEDALAIASAHLGSSDYELKPTGSNYAFAHNRPHQKVSEIIARKAGFTRRLLVGHDTRTVVWDSPLTVH